MILPTTLVTPSSDAPKVWPHRRWAAGAASVSCALLLAACGDRAPTPASAGPPGGMPPAQVGVVIAETSVVELTTELPGRLEASRVAQIRARAAGILQQRLFQEGGDVKVGEMLFRIDPATYDAALASARAQRTKSEVQLAQARAQLERYQPLLADRAVSKQDFVNAELAVKQAEADVALAKAAVQTATINRGHADVTSPIAGRIGRSLLTEGALVGQGEATPLAVVQQINPIYVNFTQSANEALKLTQALEEGRLQQAEGSAAASVKVVLEDGSEYAHAGKLLFSDLTVDSTSGQVTLRAEVPNPAGRLLPGLYVRVRLVQAQARQAITLPQQAVMRSPKGDSVMVVSGDGKVAPRPVKLGVQQAGRWVVLSGLTAGEQVMVDGFQKLRPDASVKPVPWQAPSAATPAATPASAPASAK